MIPGRAGPLACVVLCVPLLASTQARAAGDAKLAVTLEYSAAPGCPEVSAFKTVVVGRLSYDPFQESASDHVLAQIALRGRSIEGRLEWRDAAGRWAGDQNFPSRSGDCGDLVRAMGFALAVQIQLMALTNSASTQSPALPPPPAPPAPAVPPAPLERTPVTTVTSNGAAARSTPPAFAVGVGAAVGSGVSSGAVPLGRLFGAVAWQHVSLELGGEVSVPSTVRRADGAGFSQQQFLASLAACGGSRRWSACLLAKGGEIRIAGLDIDVPTSPSGPVFEAGARLAAMQQLGHRAYFSVHADGLAILTPWTVTLDQVPVWTSPRFAVIAGLDAGMRFQ